MKHRSLIRFFKSPSKAVASLIVIPSKSLRIFSMISFSLKTLGTLGSISRRLSIFMIFRAKPCTRRGARPELLNWLPDCVRNGFSYILRLTDPEDDLANKTLCDAELFGNLILTLSGPHEQDSDFNGFHAMSI